MSPWLRQIRNGWVHILDDKLGALHERPIAQLLVYALALSRRTGLRLYDFVCAWFDDRHYFEFSRCLWGTSGERSAVHRQHVAEGAHPMPQV